MAKFHNRRGSMKDPDEVRKHLEQMDADKEAFDALYRALKPLFMNFAARVDAVITQLGWDEAKFMENTGLSKTTHGRIKNHCDQ